MRKLGWIGLLGVVLAGGALGTSARAAGVVPPLVKVSSGGARIVPRSMPTVRPTPISATQLTAFLAQAHTLVAAAGEAPARVARAAAGPGSTGPTPAASFTINGSSPSGATVTAYGAQLSLPNPPTVFFNGTVDAVQSSSAVTSRRIRRPEHDHAEPLAARRRLRGGLLRAGAGRRRQWQTPSMPTSWSTARRRKTRKSR